MAQPNSLGLALNEEEFETDNDQEIVAAVHSIVDPGYEPVRQPAEAPPKDQYNLATALTIIRRMETSSARGAVFAEITSKNRIFRLVDKLYDLAGSRFLQPLILFAYMLKCILSVGSFKYEGEEAVAISNFHNEQNAIDRLLSLLPNVQVMQLSIRRTHIFGRGQFRTALQMVGTFTRLFRFLARLARAYEFMPAARIASGLAYYMRFSQLLKQHPQLGAAFVASNYSPEALGLAAAAHSLDRKVIYINHAPVPANGATVPPVLSDCAVFYGETMRRTYETGSRCNAEVALIGQPGTTHAMQWCDEVERIGIFLTALTSAKAVEKLVLAIRDSHPDIEILIRNHPVALLKSNFSDLVASHKNVRVTIGNPLDEEIQACDIIFCGNSGVAMNVMRCGRPVAYIDALDQLNHDYCGFVQNGLVCEVKNWSSDLFPMLKAFYTGPAWRNVMQSYDASYNADATLLKQKAAETVQRYISWN